MAIFWIDSSGAGSVGAERAMKRERELREIMEQAIEEMREVLSRETEEDGKEGLPLGSGAVEGGHRHVIQARLKLPGAWWKEETLNPILALRTLRANAQWEAFWI